MSKYIKYLQYLIKHKWYVFVECCKLGIPWLGITHDLSKLLPSEFVPYARYFYGGDFEYPTKEKAMLRCSSCKTKEDVLFDFDVAWLHHQKRNKHHWQYWIIHFDDGTFAMLGMPEKYRKEMLADWIGAGRAINGKSANTREWYIKNKYKISMVDSTRAWIESQLGVEKEGNE